MKKYVKQILIVGVLAVLLATAYGVQTARITARADAQTVKAWIMCAPNSYVNCRPGPSRKGDSLGMLETGYQLEIDGQVKNGFAHCHVSLERDQGWVHAGYIVFEEPKWIDKDMTITTDSRVAVRNHKNGERNAWLRSGDPVHVYWKADGWAITNRGWVQTQYITELID